MLELSNYMSMFQSFPIICRKTQKLSAKNQTFGYIYLRNVSICRSPNLTLFIFTHFFDSMENEDLTGKISAAKQLYAVQSYEECSSLIQVGFDSILFHLL